MRQGNGSEILGANDPRSADIGIIYVASTDDRESVIAAILIQERLGRKQVAVVLPDSNKAFQRAIDFDVLKSMRRKLQAQIVFIAPAGPGPGELARQRRFPVYSSLETYAQSLQEDAALSSSVNGNDNKAGGWLFRRKQKSPAAIPDFPQPQPFPPSPPVQPITNRANDGLEMPPAINKKRSTQMSDRDNVSPSIAVSTNEDASVARTNSRGYEGQQLGNYHLTRFLGTGYYTAVYECKYNQSFTAAIKLGMLGCQSEYEQSFRIDIDKIMHLRHPHVVRFLDSGIAILGGDNIPFLVMDYAPNIRQRHPEGSRLSLETIINYTKQITDALTYLYNLHLCHLHIKPENLLISKNGEILLSDFGVDLADYSDEDILFRFDYYLYAAPEYVQYLKPHQTVDEYALSTVIYEWLCGDIPFQGTPEEILNQKVLSLNPPSLHEKVPGISPDVEAVVMKALAKNPEERFESVQAFAKALEEAAFPPKIILSSSDFSGQQLGNYQLLRKVGSGGFADVYLGQHRRLNTFTAIKVLHSHMSDNAVEEFQKEAQTIAKLRHPSIVRVLDFDVENNTAFLIMDYAAHGTLRQRHPKGSRLPLATVVDYVKQVASALQFAHNQKLIHRDVKPENMLIGPNNEVLLSDFGIAAVAHSTSSLIIQKEAGTIYYMAPEQSQGKPRPASDQYSLAIVTYEWLTGSRPFNGTYWELVTQHMTAPPPPLCIKNPSIPQAVEQVLNVALAKDPHRRFANVQVFANALEQASK